MRTVSPLTRVARISLLVLGWDRTRTPFPALTTLAAPAERLPPEEVPPDEEVPAVLPPLTRTTQVPRPVPSVTVRVARPWETAVTWPSASTEAIPSSLLLQV